MWNKGKLVGQKAPFKLKEIWAILVQLQMQGGLREPALFDLEPWSENSILATVGLIVDGTRRQRPDPRVPVREKMP